jgi:ABC-2 type transport system ATP-binding protein
MLGTRKRDGGTVSILGLNPQTERKTLFETVGVQFQESSYQDSITVRELCAETQALYKSPARYDELLRRVGLSEKGKIQVGELSGGQKQRLFIVLALIPHPRVVFLDELTTGLDARARRDVWKCLAELKAEGLPVFLTSHYMDEVEALCDRIMIIKKGSAVFHGTVKEAVKSSPFDNLEDAYLWYTDEEGSVHEGV